ncbi:MAG: cob(I)yrinic acid a,c-diamide adenosyltransferase [Eubacteriales bacterium]
MDKGLVHIYHGDGKGKTTCAIGLAMRALGAGYRVIFVQFLKGGDTSELKVLEHLERVEVVRAKKDYKFTWLLTEEELGLLKSEHNILLEEAIARCHIQDDERILLVLDELCATYEKKLIDQEKVLDFIKNRFDNIEVVITGRNPAKELLDLADYVSEIKKVKHPMEVGIYARKGIEM